MMTEYFSFWSPHQDKTKVLSVVFVTREFVPLEGATEIVEKSTTD